MRRAVIEISDAAIGFELKAEPGPRGGYQTLCDCDCQEVQEIRALLKIEVQEVPIK